MATRNLTKAFIQARNGGKANRSFEKGDFIGGDSDETSDSGLLNANSPTSDSMNWKGAKSSLPPLWVDKLEAIEEESGKCTVLMRELQSLHNARLVVSFNVDEAVQEREINMKTGEITEVFRRAERLLKEFSKLGDERNISSEERTIRRNMQSQAAKTLQSMSMKFRNSQKEYMKRVQAQKAGSGDQGFDYLNDDGKPKATGVDVDMGFTSAQMLVVEEAEELVNARDKEISAIAKSIEELAQIFKELAVLVIDQGTILDRIDFNMENAVEHAKEGVVQLEKAEEHQKNATPLRCIFVLVVLIIIMICILIWKHSKGNDNNNSN